jgi:hypothetical protein
MRTLVLDIENSFLIGGAWGMWNVNFSLEQLLDEGHMLCFASKWLGEREIKFCRHDSPEFLPWLHALLDEADAVLTYNGRRHDIPFINREFVKAGYGPPSPFKHIDLLESVKKQFKFPSNKMQHVLTELGLPTKLEHEGFPLWIKCLQGEKKAWEDMKKYNINDVKVLEKLYYKLLPWIVSPPNQSLFSEDTVCPACGSKHIQSRGTGFYRTQVAKYRKFVCNDCGHWSRTRYTEIDKDTRKNIIVSAA